MALKPYYQDLHCTIYHGDCREILPLLPKADLILTDPPYGVTAVKNGKCISTSNAAETKIYAPIIGDDKPFDPTWLLALKVSLILWGANHYADKLPARARWLVWDKRNGCQSNPLADCELAWTNDTRPARLFHHLWMGMLRAGETITRQHPSEKPVELMKWCLSFFPDAQTIADPYMGSGPVLVAAKLDGRKAIGIEIEERYCEIAANRLRQSVLNFEDASA